VPNPKQNKTKQRMQNECKQMKDEEENTEVGNNRNKTQENKRGSRNINIAGPLKG